MQNFKSRVTKIVTVVALIACVGPSAARTVIDYNYRSFALLDTPPALSALGSYQQRQFSPQVAESRAISATNGLDAYTCPLAFQDATKAKTAQPVVLTIVAFSGCPFDLPMIAPERWVELRESLTIDITEVRDGAMYVAANSKVPFVAEAGRTPFPTPTAVGVVWRFARAGMRFKTAAGEFVTARNGATATFTESGVRFRGFSKSPRPGSLVLSSEGWARATMRSVQQRLTRLGHKPGPADGLWGKLTRDALASFQRSAGLDGSGALDARTLLKLGI